MFGGLTNGHSGYPTFHEEHRSQYDMTTLPQLQLFGKFPVGCTLDNINFIANDHATASSRPIKRARDPVSTGLKLSYEEDESVTSISNSIKIEMDRQKELLDHYVKLQEENMVKGLRELNNKHTISLLNALEREVAKKLSEKEMEISNMNRRNMELGLKIKQVAMEAQSWHYRAKYNESVVNALKNNIQQVMAQKVEGKEGYGDSEVDDVASYTNVNGNQGFDMKCRSCNGRDVCVLLLPCRHLCLCEECEGVTEICPVCHVVRTESVHVFMS